MTNFLRGIQSFLLVSPFRYWPVGQSIGPFVGGFQRHSSMERNPKGTSTTHLDMKDGQRFYLFYADFWQSHFLELMRGSSCSGCCISRSMLQPLGCTLLQAPCKHIWKEIAATVCADSLPWLFRIDDQNLKPCCIPRLVLLD